MHTSHIEITAKQLAAEKKAHLQEQKKQHRIDRLIKNEVLDLSDHEMGWEASYQANMKAGKEEAAYANPIFTDTNRWGRLMQVEMKRQHLTTLTPAIVKKTEAQIGEWAMRGRGLLVSTWVHGAKLGQILGWSKEVIKGSRKNYSNAVAQHIRD